MNETCLNQNENGCGKLHKHKKGYGFVIFVPFPLMTCSDVMLWYALDKAYIFSRIRLKMPYDN